MVQRKGRKERKGRKSRKSSKGRRTRKMNGGWTLWPFGSSKVAPLVPEAPAPMIENPLVERARNIATQARANAYVNKEQFPQLRNQKRNPLGSSNNANANNYRNTRRNNRFSNRATANNNSLSTVSHLTSMPSPFSSNSYSRSNSGSSYNSRSNSGSYSRSNSGSNSRSNSGSN